LTINIAIAVAEGLVMAADSMSQMQVNNQVIANHSSVEKLTEIGDVPMAAMTSGLGSIANRTIVSLIREFEFNSYTADAAGEAFRQKTVSELTTAIADFFDTRYTAAFGVNPAAPILRMIVGGYSPREFFPHIHEIMFPGKSVRALHPSPTAAPGIGSIYWSGMPVALNRLIKGVDIDALVRARDLITQAAQPGFIPPLGAPPLPAITAADPVATIANYAPHY